LPDFSAFKISKTEDQLRKMVLEDRREAFEAFVRATVPEDALPIEQILIERELHSIGHHVWDYAADNDIDFIITGAKGHSKVELLLLGSTTERLLTLNDSIPTLVVR
jgi:nucleotide-binding universal stress UspA family protein